MANDKFEFQGKYIIKADLVCVTGLHIGGTEEGVEIGGLENIVIKDPLTDYPYIPGSSLKGKIRGLLEWCVKHKDKIKKDNEEEKEVEQTRVQYMFDKSKKEGKSEAKPCDCGKCDVCIVFGFSADAKAGSLECPSRLTIRDSFPKGTTIYEWKRLMGENIYTEVKMENVIDRITSEATPRPMERVPADSIFEVEMIYDLYKNTDREKMKLIFEGLTLLEDSALGGSGTRGSGKAKFKNFEIKLRSKEYYLTRSPEPVLVDLKGSKTAKDILNKFDEIFKNEEKKK
jgi:CRISPR-associated protein Csm3